jgi:hypothetical protein
MLTAEQREKPDQSKRDKQTALDAIIGKKLLHLLGEPERLLTVQVRHLWATTYRVNIFIGADVTSAKIAHSYFLKADDDGNIGESTPKIIRLY